MQGQPNLNCKQMDEALDAYYDLELSPEEAEAVDLHLADCSVCSAKLADIDMVVSKLKTLPTVEWNGDLSDAIEARILAQSAAPAAATITAKTDNVVALNTHSKSSGSLKPRYILAAAASILALLFAYTQFAPAPHADVQVAQTPTSKAVAGVKDNLPTEQEQVAVISQPTTAVANNAKPAAQKTHVEPSQVATLPELKAIPIKPLRVESATEKMIANSEHGAARDSNNNNVNDAEEIVAVYDYDTIDSASDFGISTNEDGLYAIKL